MSPDHALVGLYTVDQILLEMSYLNKGKNLTVNRRVSLNFREGALYQIFKHSLMFNKQFIEHIQTQAQSG